MMDMFWSGLMVTRRSDVIKIDDIQVFQGIIVPRQGIQQKLTVEKLKRKSRENVFGKIFAKFP